MNTENVKVVENMKLFACYSKRVCSLLHVSSVRCCCCVLHWIHIFLWIHSRYLTVRFLFQSSRMDEKCKWLVNCIHARVYIESVREISLVFLHRAQSTICGTPHVQFSFSFTSFTIFNRIYYWISCKREGSKVACKLHIFSRALFSRVLESQHS